MSNRSNSHFKKVYTLVDTKVDSIAKLSSIKPGLQISSHNSFSNVLSNHNLFLDSGVNCKLSIG